MIKWIKPNGSEITTNELEANVEMAESLGWLRASKSFGELKDESEELEVKIKRTRRTKAQMEAARNGNSRTSTESIPE